MGKVCEGTVRRTFSPAEKLLYGASLTTQPSFRPPRILIPISLVGFGREKARKSKVFVLYQERWKQENAAVCVYACSEVSKENS